MGETFYPSWFKKHDTLKCLRNISIFCLEDRYPDKKKYCKREVSVGVRSQILNKG